MAAVPLVVEGRVLGGMGLNFPHGQPLDEDDRAFVVTLAHQCAQALERARLYAAERRARSAIEAARLEAEAANRTKTEFLAVMSHELRTPLNAIAGYVELLEMGLRGPLTDAQREDLSRIRRNQRHLLGLINDVLNFAKLETGNVRYEITDVPLREAVEAVEPLIAPQLRQRELRFASAVGDGVVARADRDKLQQILLNLLSNAVKFTEPGGEVHVEAEADGHVARLRVRDTGCGIPRERQASVFDPFVQLDQRLTRTSEGTGLGLAISRDLARAMDGDLTVASEVGVGSVFTLTLPSGTPT
jgi:signal transduction histidine kinase